MYIYLFQQYLEQANPIQQHNNIHSSALNMGLQHLFQTDNDRRKRRQLHNRHIHICDCMHRHSLHNPLLDLLNSSNQTSTSGQNQFYPQREPYGVARCTSGPGEFINNVSGDQRAENAMDGKVFVEDSSIYCVDDLSVQSEMDFSSVSSKDMSQQFPPLLPVPLLPSDEKEHGISGAKADEILYPLKGTQKFSDEDLKICLAMYNPWYEIYACIFMILHFLWFLLSFRLFSFLILFFLLTCVENC